MLYNTGIQYVNLYVRFSLLMLVMWFFFCIDVFWLRYPIFKLFSSQTYEHT